MNLQERLDTARTLVAGDKGLLAMDESSPTCKQRFAKIGIPRTVETRRVYRELVVTTLRLGDFISGTFLYDGTIRQQTTAGLSGGKILTATGIIPRIKVYIGAKKLAAHARGKF